MADTWSTTRTPVAAVNDPKTSNAISAARTYAGGPLAGSSVKDGFGNMPGKSSAGSGGCKSGGGGGPGEGRGAQNNNGLGNGLDQGLSNAFGCAKAKWEAANPGMTVYAFSGVAARPDNPNSLHPSGNALDVAIYGSDGVLMNNLYNGDAPAYRAYESFASAMHSCYTDAGGSASNLRWGGNFGGTWYHDAMHFDVGGGNTSRGDIRTGTANPLLPNWSRPQDGIKYNGPTSGAAANSGAGGEARGTQSNQGLTSKGNSAAAGCGSGGSGCQPISAGAPAAAASLAAGKGLAGALSAVGKLQSVVAAVAGGPAGLLSAGLQTAAGAALSTVAGAAGGIGLGAVAGLTQAGLSNPAAQITQGVFSQIQTIGSQSLGILGSSLSSLTGVIPAAIATGNVKGLMTSVLQSSVSGLIQQNVPHLGGFTDVFSSAAGAVAGGSNLTDVLSVAGRQIFGNAVGINGPSQLPGYNNLSTINNDRVMGSQDEGSEIIGSEYETYYKDALENSVVLVNPIEQTLPAVIDKSKINAFTSLFLDYNSLVTQGFGNLTDHLIGLGMDLLCLGKIGDLHDLLNIGTARQLARQLIENGLGLETGISQFMERERITIETLQDDQYERSLFSQLRQANDPEVIANVKKVMLINENVNLDNLADLLIPNKVLNYSKKYNRFSNFRDMALTLSLCTDGLGALENYADLGLLMMNMENAQDMPALLDELTLIRPDEKEQLAKTLPPRSKFGLNGPVIADLIGSVAGYVHENTFPEMAILQEVIFNDPFMDEFKLLNSRLTDTLNGLYTFIAVPPALNTITVPPTGRSTFSIYATLDEAAQAIINAINNELEYIAINCPKDNPILWQKITKYQGLHETSSEFLVHEKKMRQAYGADYGPPRITEHFSGDDTTIIFPLSESVAQDPNMTVRVDGREKIQFLQWNYSNNSIVFVDPPAIGEIVSVKYDTGYTQPSITSVDTWNFASALESYALETGHGGPADFLNKITTNDYHGQRIQAVMMQARNKARFDSVGIGCPGYNRVTDDASSKYINFIETTGIWAADPDRAAEIYLINNAGVESYNEYVLTRYQENLDVMKNDFEKLNNNVVRRLLFVKDGYILATNRLLRTYKNTPGDELFRSDINLGLSYNEKNVPTVGTIIGPFDEIISQIIKYEGMASEAFNKNLSGATKAYLAKIEIDLEYLVSICQRILIDSIASHTGITEQETASIFGVQSLSKALLYNTANGL